MPARWRYAGSVALRRMHEVSRGGERWPRGGRVVPRIDLPELLAVGGNCPPERFRLRAPSTFAPTRSRQISQTKVDDNTTSASAAPPSSTYPFGAKTTKAHKAAGIAVAVAIMRAAAFISVTKGGAGCDQPSGDVGGDRSQLRIGPRGQHLPHPRAELLFGQPALHKRGLERLDHLLAIGVRRPQAAAASRACRYLVTRSHHSPAPPRYKTHRKRSAVFFNRPSSDVPYCPPSVMGQFLVGWPRAWSRTVARATGVS